MKQKTSKVGKFALTTLLGLASPCLAAEEKPVEVPIAESHSATLGDVQNRGIALKNGQLYSFGSREISVFNPKDISAGPTETVNFFSNFQDATAIEDKFVLITYGKTGTITDLNGTEKNLRVEANGFNPSAIGSFSVNNSQFLVAMNNNNYSIYFTNGKKVADGRFSPLKYAGVRGGFAYAPEHTRSLSDARIFVHDQNTIYMHDISGKLIRQFYIPEARIEDCAYDGTRFLFQESTGHGGAVRASFPVSLDGIVRSPDTDSDNDVDLLDFAELQAGFSGTDFNLNGRVDTEDYAAFIQLSQNFKNGPE